MATGDRGCNSMSPTLQATRRQPGGARTAVKPMTITVLAGGPSVEREVSLSSGQAVGEALRRLGHRVTLCDIGPDDLSALDRVADFVFIALHGTFGEDGTVQALLDARGLPYSGTGAAGSELAMDKVAAKQAFVRENIPTPPYEVVRVDTVDGLEARFDVPAVVKPVASGSSVDTTIARTPSELHRDAQAVALKYGAALVERYIDGMEWTVGVLGNTPLPVCEIRPANEFYDYDAKYLDDRTQYVFDFDAPPELIEQVRSMSVRAHNALGCRAFSRVDWMIERATMKPYVLEINTIPGFTSHSLMPKAAARVGLNFDDLCQRMIELSLADRTQ